MSSLPFRKSNYRFSLIWLGAALIVEPTAWSSEPTLDFNRDIRPILSDNCYRCHGPDAQNQESDFRLNSREEAVADLGGYAGIVPGDAEASEIHFRIWEDVVDEERMPPPDSRLSLSDEEKRILDQWINEGAHYDQHWSFKPIEKPKLPHLGKTNQAWANNSIDHFIAARLDQEELIPSKSASKETLIRRVTLDLTGLPPTTEEVDQFLQDKSSNAFEKVVDRLLASPRYGERMALVWLDASRYADSGGYQNDILRSQWPWRDWVIQAYNENMPFDQFTIEQLAGDMLPNPTKDQVLATAFNRNHRINNEGGIVPEEFLVEYVADRVETTSTVWLGLTMGCARCHDHKYDPLSQEDFFELFAFFNNIDENGKDGNIAPQPNMMVYTTGTEEEHLEIQRDLKETKSLLKQLPKDRASFFQAWLDEQARGKLDLLQALRSLPSPTHHFPLDSVENNFTPNVRNIRTRGILAGRGNKDRPVLVENATYDQGLKFGTSNYVRIPKPYPDAFQSHQPQSWLVQLQSPNAFAGSEGPVLALVEEGSLKGYRLMLEGTGQKSDYRLSFQLILDSNENLGIEIVSNPVIKPNSKVRIGVTWDGRGKANGVKLYINGEPLQTQVMLDNLKAPYESGQPLLFGARAEQDAKDALRDATLNRGVIDDVQIFDLVLSDSQILKISKSDPRDQLIAYNNKLSRNILQSTWLKVDPEGIRLTELEETQEKALSSFEKIHVASVSIMEEMEEPRETYLLDRGAYDHPNKERQLFPATPDVLPSMDTSLPRNRLGLAQWIIDPNNPLTARVTINRYWQTYFGTGLVKTPEDFGSQGESPSHPKLLDYLAATFIATGWDVKAMQKLIVMSSTYQQSSNVTPDLIEIDPDNRLLARGPRFRLNGQSLRDQALAVSGLLAPQLGGLPVMPYQPEGLWDEVSAKGYKYIVGEGDDLYRRSLYTFWRRTVPPPSMMNFDNSAREICSVTSNRTNTPLQALNLLNDPQFVEAARGLAERMIKQGGDSVEEQIRFGHRLLLAKSPGEEVLRILTRGHEDYLNTFQKYPERADQLANIGASGFDISIDTVQLAAMTTIANILLNLDETLTKE